jgi:hypothetical protein
VNTVSITPRAAAPPTHAEAEDDAQVALVNDVADKVFDLLAQWNRCRDGAATADLADRQRLLMARDGDMKRQMEKIDIPPIPEFIELVADSGVQLYACKASVDMFGLTMEDFVPQVEDIISVGEFYGRGASGQVIFT